MVIDPNLGSFKCRRSPAVTIGRGSTLHVPVLAVGEAGLVTVGSHCFLDNTIFLCEQEVRIGDYVVAGWNVTIADTDFHPTAPAERLKDAIACSPSGNKANRPKAGRAQVVIEDDVYIGPNATILKGVTIGAGAWIEAGAVVVADVPAGAQVIGNPARRVGSIEPARS